MWILWMTSLSSHSTSASVSELSRLVTHTAVSSPKCNSEKRPLSNSVAFQTLFKWHRYCGILKIHIIRKINTGIRYEPVYRPALIIIILHTFILYLALNILFLWSGSNYVFIKVPTQESIQFRMQKGTWFILQWTKWMIQWLTHWDNHVLPPFSTFTLICKSGLWLHFPLNMLYLYIK